MKHIKILNLEANKLREIEFKKIQLSFLVRNFKDSLDKIKLKVSFIYSLKRYDDNLLLNM